jgi:hypothetical protein
VWQLLRAIGSTSATARSKTADPKGESTGDEFRCARARQFDGSGRSIQTAARCGFEVRCGQPAALHLSASPLRQAIARPIRADQVLRNHWSEPHRLDSCRAGDWTRGWACNSSSPGLSIADQLVERRHDTGWPAGQQARNVEPEHDKFTMDPWRALEKILPGHSCDQLADLTGDPRTPTSPATT